MGDIIARKLWNAKWGLWAMTLFSWVLAFYLFITPAQGGQSFFMVTPTNGIVGVLAQLPWFLIVFGALALIGSFVSRSTWVLGLVEPIMGAVLLVVGLWELSFPYDFVVSSQVWAFVGLFLGAYVAFVGLEIDRKLAGIWPAVLAIAACVVVVSLLNLFRVGGESMTQILSCLSLFLSGFGFLYGAVRLSGVAPSKRAVRERQFKNLALDGARTEA